RVHLSDATYLILLSQPPPRSTLFPYTTLFRSLLDSTTQHLDRVGVGRRVVELEFAILEVCEDGGEKQRARLIALFPPSSQTSRIDRKSTRLNSSHVAISYAVFCLKKKKKELRT